MEKLTLDTGLVRYRINGGGVLTFNPADPNVYVRFMDAVEEIKDLEKSLQTEDGDVLQLLRSADQRIKALLGTVFGGGNDFDAILGGVNLLAVAGNGERIITNLLTALQPVLIDGAKRCAGLQIQAATQKASQRRAKA